VGVVSLNPRLIALIPPGCLVAFTEKCLKRGQFDSQKTFENLTQQAFEQGVRAGGDGGFKKQKNGTQRPSKKRFRLGCV
jgi:hypothetical protein